MAVAGTLFVIVGGCFVLAVILAVIGSIVTGRAERRRHRPGSPIRSSTVAGKPESEPEQVLACLKRRVSSNDPEAIQDCLCIRSACCRRSERNSSVAGRPDPASECRRRTVVPALVLTLADALRRSVCPVMSSA